jgi:peptide/nickel transport system ATP-binding protein
MTAPETILHVRGLTVGPPLPGAKRILDGVGFSLRRGEFLAIVGESGSGKTTLSRALTGLLPPELRIVEGRVGFDGIDLTHLREREFSRLRGRDIGYVPQDPGMSLNPTKTIGFQLAEVFRLHPDAVSGTATVHDRCITLLEQVGIDHPTERMRQYPHQLSGGQKQRVLIAIAFALNPKLLIADEPTSALDATVQRQVMTVLDRLVRERGTTVVFITHNIALAADHASHILVLRDGRVIENNTAADILVEPAAAYTRQLLGHERPAGLPRTDFGRCQPPDPILEVEHLVKVFASRGLARPRGGLTAVDGVSFSVPRGSTFALVGESGSGKSTTARIIAGLEQGTSGRVRLNGADITRLRTGERRRVWRDMQFVHQNPDSALNPRETVMDIVASPLRAHGIAQRRQRQERVAALMHQVGLPPATVTKRPFELSGGQCQRVALARALALDVSLLILDEALSALDVVTQDQVIALLRDLRQDLGLSLLFISHDLTLVERFADFVGVMHEGRMVEFGPIDRVFHRPETHHTRSLLAARPGRGLRPVGH